MADNYYQMELEFKAEDVQKKHLAQVAVEVVALEVVALEVATQVEAIKDTNSKIQMYQTVNEMAMVQVITLKLHIIIIMKIK